MTKFYYQGHGSYRITAADGIVIYMGTDKMSSNNIGL